MNAFSETHLNLAVIRLEHVLASLRTYGHAADVASVLSAIGDIAAARQLNDIQASLESAPTERPSHLRVIK